MRSSSAAKPAQSIFTHIELFRLENTSWDQLGQALSSGRVSNIRLPRPTSCWVLNVSKDADSTISLGNLFQYWITLRVKQWLSVFRWNFLVFNLCPSLLLLSASTAEKSLAHSSSFLPIKYSYTLLRSPLNLIFSRLNSLLEGWKVCYPEIQGCSPALHLASSSQGPEPHHLMVPAAKTVFDLCPWPIEEVFLREGSWGFQPELYGLAQGFLQHPAPGWESCTPAPILLEWGKLRANTPSGDSVQCRKTWTYGILPISEAAFIHQ